MSKNSDRSTHGLYYWPCLIQQLHEMSQAQEKYLQDLGQINQPNQP